MAPSKNSVSETEAEEEYFFEGVEKLLEMWFKPSDDNNNKSKTLRSVDVEKWREICEIAHCQILSTKHNSKMDAYLLSESSMYVSDQRFILKTCGRTSLMHVVGPVIQIGKDVGLDVVENIFYSRKNFARPELQPEPHSHFENETSFLDQFFSEGAGYCLGKINRDRWYMYTLNPVELDTLSEEPDQTLEILMTDLDPDVMNIFNMETCQTAAQATKKSGIDGLLPYGTLIDDYLFEPCGYSMNALLPNSDQYCTIHITPETEFSYVSFEINSSQAEYWTLVNKVLACFKPGKFLLTLIYNTASQLQCKENTACRDFREKQLLGYRRDDAHFLELDGYFLSYTHHVREGFGKPGGNKKKLGGQKMD